MNYFPSKKDLWVGALLWGIVFGCVLFELRDLLQSSDWSGLVFVILWLTLLGWTWFGTGYTITDKFLEVKCGPLQTKIPLSKIRSVKHTRALWAGFVRSYTLSRDRLEIKYRYGTILISPADAFTFVSELKQRCPDAEFVH
jgi:hypothetical protein